MMEFSTSEGVSVYITGDLCNESEEEEEEVCKDSKCESSTGEPTVYITELPKSMSRALAQELKIPSKKMGEGEMLLSQLQSDGKGNSIVTIQVPVDGYVSEDDENVETIDLQFSDGILSSEFSKSSSRSVLINKPEEVIISGGEKYVIKPVQNIKSRVPIWKRHVPKPPGSISNYMYPHSQRSPRSRVIIDCPTNIPVQEFKAQLADTSDIVTTLDVAPSTKRKIKELTTNSVSKLFAYPGKPYPNKRLYNLYQRHLTSKPQTHVLPDDLELQPVGYTPTINYTQLKRISRVRKPNDANVIEINGQTEVPPQSVKLAEDSIVQAVVPLNDQVVRVLIKPGVMGESEQEILVLHDGTDKQICLDGSTSLQHSIEVLLAAAAAESGDNDKDSQQEQVFICSDGTFDGNMTDPFMSEQIIIVQSDYEGDEICGQTIESV